MKKIIMPLLALVFILGCAGSQTVDDSLYTQTNIPTAPKVIYKEVMFKDSIMVKNLTWESSDNLKTISSDPHSKLFFDMGIAYQLGILDGNSGRKITRDERVNTYPIFKEYAAKDAVKFVDLNVAYEGGYNLVKRVAENKPKGKAE